VNQVHHLKAESVESASEVSSPDLNQVHHLKAESVESALSISVPELLEKIKLSDVVSKTEYVQIRRWFEDQFEEGEILLEKIAEIIKAIKNDLSEYLSNEGLQWLIEFLSNLPAVGSTGRRNTLFLESRRGVENEIQNSNLLH